LKETSQKAPDFDKPIDILAFFMNELGACGCSELEPMIRVVRDSLEWAGALSMEWPPKPTVERAEYDTLYGGDVGLFYIIIGILDHAGLINHGTSVRYPFLSEQGKMMLAALKKFSPAEIEEAKGEAYDALAYGMFND
jgi:hypothetical protein